MNTRLAPVALALGALALGCVDNYASVLPYAICAAPSDATKCSLSGTCDATVSRTGLDVALSTELQLGVELHNQLVNNADTGTGGTGGVNSHDAFVRQVVVSYSGGGLSIPGQTTDEQATVPAAGTATMWIRPIPAQAGADLAAALGAGGEADIIASVKFKGIYGDGSSFETGAYTIPVYVCNGCGTVGVPFCTGTKTVTAVCPGAGQYPLSWTCE